METWANQDELGRQLGIDAQSVGDLLVAAGLKVGREATDEALDRGLAEPGVTPLGRPFVRWRAEDVLPLIEPLAQRLKAAPASNQPKEQAGRRSAPKQPALKQPVRGVSGTTFDVVVALHAFSEPSSGPTGWAYVNQETWESTSGGVAEASEEEAELVAALHLLDHVPSDAHLLVRSSSEHLVKTATVWAPTWRRNGWKKRDGQTPQHVDLVKQLVSRIDARKGRTRFGLGAPDDGLIIAAAQAAVEASRQESR